jgi:iron complex outermembrane receptor protein
VSFDVFAQSSPTAEFYLNDALIEPNVWSQVIYDVARMEVLRGPQATLRGRSAPSGAFSFMTRRPDLNAMGSYVSSIVTHSGDQNFQGALGVPLIPEKLAVRVAALYDDNDGSEIESVTTSVKTSDETRSARTTLRFEPTEAIGATLMYQYNEHNYDDVGLRLFGPGAPSHATHPVNYHGPASSIEDDATIREDVTPNRSRTSSSRRSTGALPDETERCRRAHHDQNVRWRRRQGGHRYRQRAAQRPHRQHHPLAQQADQP